MKAILPLHYFPCIEYFVVLLKHEQVILDIGEHYVKQSYRNRCKILTTNGVQSLVVPVRNGNSLKKQAVKDIQIDYQQNWVHQHWRAITSAYNNSPFFEFFADDFEKILFKKPVFLADITQPILTKCLIFFGLEKKVQISEVYFEGMAFAQEEKKINEYIDYQDFRNQFQLKKSIFNPDIYKPVAYKQVFGNDFEPNLSIIDLICCEGRQSREILSQSVR